MVLFGFYCISLAKGRRTESSEAAIRRQSRVFCALSAAAFLGGLGLQLSAIDATGLVSGSQPILDLMFTFNSVYMLFYLEMATRDTQDANETRGEDHRTAADDTDAAAADLPLPYKY
jgi:hypothetical protein